MSEFKIFVMLHMILMLYSMCGICSKLAAQQSFLSLGFCLYYAVIVALAFIYAVVWQQIIKKIPITLAFANKAVTVVWGIIWGACFFHESVTAGKIAGAILIIAGIVIYAKSDERAQEECGND